MELFKLLGTIAINNSDAKKALDETSAKGRETEGKLKKTFGAIGKGAVAIGKTIGTGLAVGGTAMAGLTVKALNMSGELEQNMGGSEAVFGKYANKMQGKAKEAFGNMGLSTSDYLATANKMGALFQGAGFSIEDSMNLSSDAMQRAADVASIMGIDTSAAMEAVAGAAKGNFTMMDNLGVAMNDTTLNAYAMEKGINKTTQEMTNQEKIGLAMELFMDKTAYAAGNYAKENETLAGSLGTAKAALTNFLDGSGDVDQLVGAFKNAANVIVDNVKTIAPRLISGITDLVNQIVPMIPPLLNQLLPVIISGAVSLINGLVSALPGILEALMGALPAVIAGVQSIFDAVVQALPQIMQALVSALPTLIPMLVDALVSMIVMLCTMLPQIIMPIVDNLPMIIESIVNALLQNLPILIDGVMQLIIGLTGAMPRIIVTLIRELPNIVEQIISALIQCLVGSIPDLLEVGKNLIYGLFGGILALVGAIPDVLKAIWDGIVNGFKKLFGIHSPSTVMMELGKFLMQGLINGIKALVGKIKEIWNNIKSTITNVWKAIKTAVTSAVNSVKTVVTNVFNTVKNTASKIWNSIKSSISNVVNGIKTTVSNVFNSIKTKTVSVWNGVKNAILNPVETAKNKVKGIVNSIKGFFNNMKLNLPKIKLPHFKVSGKLSISPPSVPKLSIEWYKKAMSNPMVMNDPTIFGYNPSTGSFMGGGEAGSEVVSGTNTLMNMIGQAVESKTATQMEGVISVLTAILNAILSGNAELLRATLSDKSFKVGEREFARLVKRYA